MYSYSERVANTPGIAALVDKSSGKYYLVQFERYEDVKISTTFSGVAADTVVVLEETDIKLRTCDALVHTAIALEPIPITNDGFTWAQMEDLVTSTLRFVQNNDPFQTLDMAVNDLMVTPPTDGTVARRNAAGGFLATPGYQARYGGLPYFYPPIFLHRDERRVTLTTPAGGALAAIQFNMVLWHRISRFSSSPQVNCGYTLAACEGDKPVCELIGPNQYALTRGYPSIVSASSRIQPSGIEGPGISGD